jgi:hypothetical protein
MPLWRLSVICLCALFAPFQEQDKSATSQPAKEQQDQPALRRPEQQSIYEKLIREKEERRRPLLPTKRETESASPAATAESEAMLLEGDVIVDRSGVLIREGGVSFFEFDAISGEDGGLARMEILKNQLLERMESISPGEGVKFEISAEITRYRGRNYLFIKKVSVRVGHGNLSP